MEKILTGTVVLDLTRFFSGPQATLFLAGLGAEVIKIDDPATGDPTTFSPPFAGPEGVSFHRKTQADMGIAYLKRARGKKSVGLNLKAPEGRAAFMKLVRSADVVIDNFSAGVADRLGIGYETLREANPGIVHCSLTGYGSTGPERNLKAYDLMVQAAVGMMSVTGQPDAPPAKAGSPLSDAIAGTFAATGILAALLHRNRTGEGQSVDVSMADCLFALMFDEPFDCYRSLGLPLRQGNRIMRFSPFNAYRTRDGWVVAGAATQDDWNALLRAMGREDLAENPQINSLSWRLANNATVDSLMSSWTEPLESAEVLRRLNEVKVPCSPVREIGEVMEWAQLKDRDMMMPLWNPLAQATVEAKGPGFPIKFSASKAAYDTPAPLPGQHSREVLMNLGGFSAHDVDAMARRGIISAP
ncbi:CaiB/BaiF CoA transferase family protein [Achromobacter agilis]|uniref:Acetyl-CoA:oxalate CoA-transferase n=1 Tax=Achromobacter agilis TaxID=1353888 RepID=A0A446C4E9_9BURK|nr:CoA transferase [Achromobacter agilis]SSW62693.1 Acetyl-CoA:oxalate CoA-transferase [Achromobacter agilis]